MVEETTVVNEIPAPGSSKKRLSIVVIGVIIISGLFGAGLWWHQMRTSVKTDNAKVAGDMVDISVRISGQVKNIEVKEGDAVTKGQVLMELDNSPYENALRQARAGLAVAEANAARVPYDIGALQAGVRKSQAGVEAAQAALEIAGITLRDAQRSLEKQTALFKEGAVSQAGLDAAQTACEKARAGLVQAQANLDAARATLEDSQGKLSAAEKTAASLCQAQLDAAAASSENARLNLENTIIKAPADGTILKINVAVGETANTGQSVLTMADLNTVWVTANIDEGKISRVRAGQAAEVKIDAYPGKTLAGQVDRIGDAAQSAFAVIAMENTSGNYTKVTQRLQIKIKLENPGVVLKPGMSAIVKIDTRN